MSLSKENEITPQELAEQRNSIFVVDVRENDEFNFCNIHPNLHLPIAELEARYHEIPSDQTIAVHCRSGGRSEKATKFLLSKGYTKVKNLVGGILRYSDDVDPSIPKY